jgi:hypothetical protein
MQLMIQLKDRQVSGILCGWVWDENVGDENVGESSFHLG